MGRSNNAVLAPRISADEQLYKDSTDKGSQQETLVAAPKMTPDLCSCLPNCFPAQLSPGRQKTLAAGYRNLTLSVYLALPPGKSWRCSRGTKSANCRERLEQTLERSNGTSHELHVQIPPKSSGLRLDPTPD